MSERILLLFFLVHPSISFFSSGKQPFSPTCSAPGEDCPEEVWARPFCPSLVEALRAFSSRACVLMVVIESSDPLEPASHRLRDWIWPDPAVLSRAAKSGGGQGGPSGPLDPAIPTHFRLDLHAIERKLPTAGPPWLSASYHHRCARSWTRRRRRRATSCPSG